MNWLKTSLSLVIFTVLFSLACSEQKVEEVDLQTENVSFDQDADEVKFDDVPEFSLDSTEFDAENGGQTQTFRQEDNSQVTVMTDRYGNKTEIRSFYNHSRLSRVILQTAPDGSHKVFVYGQNGQVESLPKEMFAEVLTAPADELANAAKIYITRQTAPTITHSRQNQSDLPLKPMPSSNFPIQKPSNENVQPSEANDSPSVEPDANETRNEEFEKSDRKALPNIEESDRVKGNS